MTPMSEGGVPQGRFTLRYSEPLLREAVRTYVWRRAVLENKRFWAVTMALLALLAWSLANGIRGWPIAVQAFGVAIAFLFLAVLWRAHHVNTLGAFRRLTRPEAQLSFSETAVTVETDLGSGTLPWSTMTEVWEQPGYWMVFTSRNQFMTWPVAGLPEEVRAWLRERLARRSEK